MAKDASATLAGGAGHGPEFLIPEGDQKPVDKTPKKSQKPSSGAGDDGNGAAGDTG
jgi:hypothetical protein